MGAREVPKRAQWDPKTKPLEIFRRHVPPEYLFLGSYRQARVAKGASKALRVGRDGGYSVRRAVCNYIFLAGPEGHIPAVVSRNVLFAGSLSWHLNVGEKLLADIFEESLVKD